MRFNKDTRKRPKATNTGFISGIFSLSTKV
jgi:hypothetical protein